MALLLCAKHDAMMWTGLQTKQAALPPGCWATGCALWLISAGLLWAPPTQQVFTEQGAHTHRSLWLRRWDLRTGEGSQCEAPSKDPPLHLLLGNSVLLMQRSGGPYKLGVVTPPKD